MTGKGIRRGGGGGVFPILEEARHRHEGGKCGRICVHNFPEKGIALSKFACPLNNEKGCFS